MPGAHFGQVPAAKEAHERAASDVGSVISQMELRWTTGTAAAQRAVRGGRESRDGDAEERIPL